MRPRARDALRAVIAGVQLELTGRDRRRARDRARTAGGDVRWREFASHAFETLMHVAHDREVARMEAAHGSHFDEKGEGPPPTTSRSRSTS